MSRIPGMLRAAAFSPRVHLANPAKNAEEIACALKKADETGVSLCVFPELCLTGSTCGDLFFQRPLLEQAKQALLTLAALDVNAAFIVGLPLEMCGRLYDCAAVVCGGEVSIVPRLYPAARFFAPGSGAPAFISLGGRQAAVLSAQDAVFACGDFVFGVCVGGDMTSPFSPAAEQCASGALVIANPNAEAETMDRQPARRAQLCAAAHQLSCALVHAGAGDGESTTDGVYAGFNMIIEAGEMLCQSMGFCHSCDVCADVDCERLRFMRTRSGLYAPFAPSAQPFALAGSEPAQQDDLLRPLRTRPFIPADNGAVLQLSTALDIQVAGLLSRMRHIGARKLVIGVSGGLDSTMALLAAALAYDTAQWPASDIVAITMPGLGTSARTKGNADKLMELLGCTCLDIPIGPAVSQHFADIGQDPQNRDVCYENSQARERTQILMDYANKVGGIVLGTGDLSELALGFCTYNGDQMSMYNVNGSIPKTLMRELAPYAAHLFGGEVERVVRDIVDTPVSPELVPGEQEISQKTEEILGSYDLHDFFLWHMMDSGAGPAKLYALACAAFRDEFDRAAILRALNTFVRRFFSQQFKRSAMPDGADATGVSLSPRGGFVAPSDAQRAMWVAEVEALKA